MPNPNFLNSPVKKYSAKISTDNLDKIMSKIDNTWANPEHRTLWLANYEKKKAILDKE
jgi:hypothetical protein